LVTDTFYVLTSAICGSPASGTLC